MIRYPASYTAILGPILAAGLSYFFTEETTIGGTIHSIDEQFGEGTLAGICSVVIGGVALTTTKYYQGSAYHVTAIAADGIGILGIGAIAYSNMNAITEIVNYAVGENTGSVNKIEIIYPDPIYQNFQLGKNIADSGFIVYVATLRLVFAANEPLHIAVPGYITYRAVMSIGETAWNFMYSSPQNKTVVHYSEPDQTYKTIACAPGCCTVPSVGTNEIINANINGSNIFGKGGLDFINLGSAADTVYFSMCSTKIVNGHVATINNFHNIHDRIVLFCTLQQVEESDIRAYYNQSEDMTYLHIAGKFEPTAIAVVGYHPSIMYSIEYNEKYGDVCPSATRVLDDLSDVYYHTSRLDHNVGHEHPIL